MTDKNSGPAEGVKGAVEDVKGKAKEAVGTVAASLGLRVTIEGDRFRLTGF